MLAHVRRDKGFMNKRLFHFMNNIIDYYVEIDNLAERKIQLPNDLCIFCMREGKNTYALCIAINHIIIDA